MTIQPGQIYSSADPRGGARIRIVRYTPGHDHAAVIDAATNKRPRWIRVQSLHATPLTANGHPWRTGYVLDTPENR